MADEASLEAEVRAHIGREIGPWTYEVTSTGVRAFARGVGYTDLVYFDADAAAPRGFDALPAPPCFLGTPVYTPGASDERFSTPHGTGYRPRFGMRHSLDAGTEVTYERPLRAGDVLSVTDRVVSAEIKHGRKLGTMVVVTSESVGRDPQGDVLVRERSTIVFH